MAVSTENENNPILEEEESTEEKKSSLLQKVFHLAFEETEVEERIEIPDDPQKDDTMLFERPVEQHVTGTVPLFDSDLVSDKAPKPEEEDEFAALFRAIDRESEEKKAAAGPAEPVAPKSDSLTDVDRELDDLLSSLFADKPTTPEQKAEAVDTVLKQTASTPVSEPEKAEEKPSVEATIVLPDLSETNEPKTEEVSPDKTQVIDLEKPIVAKHSLYAGTDYNIDRTAIDEFFGDKDEENVKIHKPSIKRAEPDTDYLPEDGPEVEESLFDVFEDEIEDYDTIDDAAPIRAELADRRKSFGLRFGFTVLLTALTVIFNNSFLLNAGLELGRSANIINLILVGLIAIINFRTLIKLFSGDMDVDAVAAVTTLVVIAQSAVSLFCFEGEGAGLGVLAGLSMCMMLLGKLSKTSAMMSSFDVIATNEDKKAISLLFDSDQANDIAGGSDCPDPTIGYGKNTTNVGGFFKNWYRPNPTDRHTGLLLLVAAVVAVLAGVAGWLFLEWDIASVLCAAVTAFSLVCAPSVFLVYPLPMKRMILSLKAYHATVMGYNGAKALAHTNEAVLTSHELFPTGSVILQNMMPLSSNKIDASITKAAALAKAADSPLFDIFNGILEGKVSDFPTVDSVKYENKLGLSGWVDNEPVLIGNRTLLENHNVKTPSTAFDRRIMEAGYFPVYLACNSVPCLLFVVQYQADPEVSFELNRLVNTGTVILIDSCDPNINKSFLADFFGLAEEDLHIMSQSGVRTLHKVSAYEKSADGFGLFKEKSCGFLAALSGSHRLISVCNFLRAVNILGIVVGLATVGYVCYAGNAFPDFIALLAALLQITFLCISGMVAFLKRP